ADVEAEEVFAAELTAPRIAVMLGNENRGLSHEAVALADRRLTIPMAGMVRSLNLSVTAAIVLFEVTRQRGQAGMESYLFSPEERDALLARLDER
ncbi:MAG: RNA methyltransferase, partial [Dehalococcoidia bacterium]|nr:RNA methyltransferase [Dehalococcoidia bacterium]